MRSWDGSSTPGRYFSLTRLSTSSAACSSVRVCSVVRTPARESSTAIAVPNEPAPITAARRAPGNDACARVSTAGRTGGLASTAMAISVLTRASVAVALRSRPRARSPRPPSPARPPASKIACKSRILASKRSSSQRPTIACAGTPRCRARVATSATILPSRLVVSSRPSPTTTARLASIRASKSIASSTNGAPVTRPAPSRAHSPPASPPAAPVIGTFGGSPNASRRRRRRATAAPSAPF
jgi:hypothetical protein